MNIKLLPLFFFFWFITIPLLNAQRAIFGYVYDAETGESLVGANIVDMIQLRGTSTNEFGFYTLSLSNFGKTDLEISYVGYQKKNLIFNIERDTSLNIYLTKSILQTVDITDTKLNSITHGTITLPIEQLKAIPMIAGEADLLKALSLTPGVATGIEGTSGLYVRGGTPDQNLILLDGATVYNTAHLFGFLSVFNPDAVKNVTLLKGGFSAKYGGRLSSVIDVTMKEGNNQKRSSTLNIGILSSSFTHESPIVKGKSSFLIAGRTAYLGALMLPTLALYKTGKTDNYVNFLMYDFNAKVNFQLTPNQKLFISTYLGQDKWFSRYREGASGEMKWNLDWGNQTFSARYTNMIKSNLFFNALLNYNRFRYENKFAFQDSSTNKQVITFSNLSAIQDVAAKAHLSWRVNQQHELKMGLEITQHLFKPNHSILLDNMLLQDSLSQTRQRYRPYNYTFFMEDDIYWNTQIKTNIGLRINNYLIDNQHFLAIQPRLALCFDANENTNWAISYSRMQQPIHLLINGFTGLSNDIWLPATTKTPPQIANVWALSFSKKWLNQNWELQIETFYKTMKQQIDFRDGMNFFQNRSTTWEDLIERNGIGRAYGIELFLRKQAENWYGWVAYTLAWNERKFSTLNNANWYPQRYDRRHNLNIVGMYKLNNKWTLNANFVLMTGNAVTLPNVAHIDLDGRRVVAIYTQKNNQRMPTYNRLDVSFVKNYITKRGYSAKWTYSIYNAYAYPNAFAVDYSLQQEIYYSINRQWVQTNNYISNTKIKVLFMVIPGISWSLKL